MRNFAAVIDSNVLLGLYSGHDVYDSHHAGVDPLRKQVWRLRCVGDALRLAIHLHETKAKTYGFLPEFDKQIGTYAPPANSDLKTQHTYNFIFFVRDLLLPDWDDESPAPNPALKGKHVDAELLRRAQLYGCPLITNEGNAPDGIGLNVTKKDCLRQQAISAGHPVYTPGEYNALKNVGTAGTEAFMQRFRELAPGFVNGRPDADRAAVGLNKMYEYFVQALTAPDTHKPAWASALASP